MSQYIVEVVENDFVERRWTEVETLVESVFKDSSFNEKFTVERPLWHIQEGIKGNLGKGIKHVLGLSSEGDILAGAFCIPTYKEDGQTECDIGWFYASGDLSKIQKIRVLDAIFNTVHQAIKSAGFTRIVTNMGTREGAKYLERRQRYTHQPIGEKTNNWVKIL